MLGILFKKKAEINVDDTIKNTPKFNIYNIGSERRISLLNLANKINKLNITLRDKYSYPIFSFNLSHFAPPTLDIFIKTSYAKIYGIN